MTTVNSNPVLLTEILQYQPQLLLDDIINVANESLYHAVEALEVFLSRWVEGRGDDVQREVYAGLDKFQSLLESCSDTSFDFFELWALRNIFTLPASNTPLPIVLPHHSGLELKEPENDEYELRSSVDELRSKVENAKRLNRQLRKANHVADRRLSRLRSRYEQLAFLRGTSATVSSLPVNLAELLPALLALPTPSYPTAPDPNKKPWEEGKQGYLNWGIRRLVDRGRSGAALEGLVEKVDEVGEWESLPLGQRKAPGKPIKGKGRASRAAADEDADGGVADQSKVAEEDMNVTGVLS